MSKSLGEIAAAVGGKVVGASDISILGVATIEDAKPGDIVFALNGKYLEAAFSSQASAVIVGQEVTKAPKPVIRTNNPRLAFAKVLELFAPVVRIRPGVHPTAILGEGVNIGEGAAIGACVTVGDKVSIGNGVVIYPQSYVGDEVIIGAGSIIYPRVTLGQRVRLGQRVIIHSGAVIGSDGFGYLEVDGRHQKIPQNGTVVIHDDVEIGANVTIDRATTGATSIGRGTKIDNLVQIAHNVTIGEDCLVVAQTGISGSVKIGDHVTLAGQVGVAGHLSIGSGAVIAAKSGVTKDIEAHQYISGFPAKPHEEEKRIKAAIPRLPQLLKRVKELERKLGSANS
ncbi:MAG: UDP-3-O-(3-hydroxymyristoyl)glucosamine N-acyltransferase [bacterium]